MTIKTLILLIAILTLQDSGKRHVFTASGIEGLIIGEATLEQIKVKFPKGKTTKSVSGGGRRRGTSVLYTDGSTAWVKMKRPKTTSTYYIVKDEGIEFYLGNGGKLSTITIWSKNGYTSDKGFELGTSTFGEADSLYDISDFGYTYGREIVDGLVWGRFSENLLFFSGDTTSSKRSDSLLVDFIVITGPNKD